MFSPENFALVNKAVSTITLEQILSYRFATLLLAGSLSSLLNLVKMASVKSGGGGGWNVVFSSRHPAASLDLKVLKSS